MSESKWYALFVKTGEEENVKKRLIYRIGDRNIRVVVPRRCMRERKQGVWSYKIRPLFPGYILLNGILSGSDCELFNDVPGVIHLIRDRDGPQEISENEMRIIGRLICNDDIIGDSYAYFEGGSIKVTGGPLMGLEGYIAAVDKRKGRAKVQLNIMGQPRIVELSIAFVVPA
ncbi:MAG: antiterminator LoaP [Acetivibrionales bacterium]|jgi:transcriptional antiterminator NusG